MDNIFLFVVCCVCIESMKR